MLTELTHVAKPVSVICKLKDGILSQGKHSQSSHPWTLAIINLVYVRITIHKVLKGRHIATASMTRYPIDGGSTKLGVIPAGGGKLPTTSAWKGSILGETG